MSALKIQILGEEGYPAKVTYELDGTPITNLCRLSRELTHTDDEEGNGVFCSQSAQIYFMRGDTERWVEFGEVWDVQQYATAEEIFQAIQARVELVRGAFAKAYPAKTGNYIGDI